MGKINIVVRIAVKPGRLDDAKANLAESLARMKVEEPGTLGFEFYLDEASGNLTLLETYKNSEALLAHLGNLAKGKPTDAIALTSVEVFGDPSPQAKGALGMFAPKFYPLVMGLGR